VEIRLAFLHCMPSASSAPPSRIRDAYGVLVVRQPFFKSSVDSNHLIHRLHLVNSNVVRYQKTIKKTIGNTRYNLVTVHHHEVYLASEPRSTSQALRWHCHKSSHGCNRVLLTTSPVAAQWGSSTSGGCTMQLTWEID